MSQPRRTRSRQSVRCLPEELAVLPGIALPHVLDRGTTDACCSARTGDARPIGGSPVVAVAASARPTVTQSVRGGSHAMGGVMFRVTCRLTPCRGCRSQRGPHRVQVSCAPRLPVAVCARAPQCSLPPKAHRSSSDLQSRRTLPSCRTLCALIGQHLRAAEPASVTCCTFSN